MRGSMGLRRRAARPAPQPPWTATPSHPLDPLRPAPFHRGPGHPYQPDHRAGMDQARLGEAALGAGWGWGVKVMWGVTGRGTVGQAPYADGPG